LSEHKPHIEPLITTREGEEDGSLLEWCEVKFKNFDEKEEASAIKKLICLQLSYIKSFLVVPLLAICTCFFFLLFLHWYPKLRM
jgi:hypothetical protein